MVRVDAVAQVGVVQLSVGQHPGAGLRPRSPPFLQVYRLVTAFNHTTAADNGTGQDKQAI